MEYKTYSIIIKGIVQGVGFRPHVYRLAMEYDLKGWVLNSSSGIFMEIEGEEQKLHHFMHRLQEEPPPLALISSFEAVPIKLQGFSEFTIRLSESQEEKSVMISPDIAICSDCKREVRDQMDRRFGYPFTNCTNCGPRFTIIKDVPYDRAKTTMAPFPMCPQCQSEYGNPAHRRFHAQPNACPICGPQIEIVDNNGQKVEKSAVEMLKAGSILAVKGLGGFHLAADARNEKAVQLLRFRKRRDIKPFAVMVRDVDTARRYCLFNDAEEKLLSSPQAPIVVMEARKDNGLPVKAIHPGLNTLGIMLPYTPMHYLLFDGDLDILIMTSANISDEPLIIDNEAALQSLKDIADYFILHNREIYNPCDDSVTRITLSGELHFFRRARGYVPRGIKILRESEPVLAVGGEMKNTFCMTRAGIAFPSQHWGDMNHYLNYINFQTGIQRFQKMLDIEPRIIAHDLHPDYQTSRWARNQAIDKKIAVQHHWAHMAAVMAENQIEGQVLGLICDGTGWGLDGAVWGCELLRGDYKQFERLGHLKYMPLPGGDLTVKKPYRMAFNYLYSVFGQEAQKLAVRFLPDLSIQEMDIIKQQLDRRDHLLQTSSCGRLFDAVSALLNICSINRSEGQAAIELEAAARLEEWNHYPYGLDNEYGSWMMDVQSTWENMVGDLLNDVPIEVVAGRFHLTMAEMFSESLRILRDENGLNRIVLSGGVFHNQILLLQLIRRLQDSGFEVYQHRLVPPGDGGISLGQASIASEVFS